MAATFNDHDRHEWDAIVVGSGLGGLTTAAYLATNGLKPLVLEQHDIVGGCTQVFRRKGRFEWDNGSHYVGDCGPDGVLPTIFRGLGLDDRVTFAPLDPDGFDVFRFGDFEFRIPAGWDELAKRLVAAFPENAPSIRSCLHELHAIGRLGWSAFAPTASHPANVNPSNLNLLRAGFGAFRRQPVSVLKMVRSINETMTAFMNRHQLAEKPARVIGAYTSLIGNDPRDSPAIITAVLMESLMRSGGWYPRGGSATLGANLADVIKANGGAIRTKATVERILVHEGRVQGVRLLGGETYSAPIVVSNADPKRTFESLIEPEHVSRRTRRRVTKWRFTGQLVVLYLAVDIDVRDMLGATNIWLFPRDIESAFDHSKAQSAIEPGQDPVDLVPAAENMFAFICSAEAKDPPRATARFEKGDLHCTFEVMTYVSPELNFWGVDKSPFRSDEYRDGEAYLRVKQAFIDRLTARTVEALPELAGHIIWQELSTPITHERYTSATDGNWGGIEVSRSQLAIRPRPRTEIAGLFLTGVSSLYGAGVSGAVRGGVATASTILQRDLWHEVVTGRVFGDPSRLPEHTDDWDPYFASKRMSKSRSIRHSNTATVEPLDA